MSSIFRQALLIGVLSVGIFYSVFSQTAVSGKVTDNKGNPLPGVNVIIKDSYDGGSSDENGNYKFTVSENGTFVLVASFVGYENAEQTVKLDGTDLKLIFKLKEKVNELNAVTISAGSIEANDIKKAVILRPLDIVTTAGSNGDVYGALQTLPGTQPIGETEGLFVRGGAASETKTIVDGLAVQHPFTSSVPDVAGRGRFSPFLFKSTSFSTGGYSAVYGQALSSALVLETTDLPDKVNSTSLGVTSVGLNAGHSHRWKKTSAGADIGYFNLAPYFAIAKTTPNIRYDKPVQAGQGSFIFRQKTSRTGLLKVYGNINMSEIGIGYRDLDSSSKFNSFTNKNTLFYGTASYREIIAEHWSLFGALSYSKNQDDRRFNQFNFSASDFATQGRLTLTRSIGQLSDLKFGGELQSVTYNSGSFQNFTNQFQVFKDTLKENYYAGYAESNIFFSGSFVARVGARLEYVDLIKKINVAPRISLAYKTGANSQVSLAYGDFYQNPGYQFYKYANSYQFDSSFPEYPRVATSLQSKLNYEKATHYILNYQIITEKRTFRVEAYYKQYSDLVKLYADTLRDAQNFRVNTSALNKGTGYAKGFELFWRDQQTLKYTDYWISYSFLDTKRDYLSYPMLAQPIFAARHTFSVVYKRFFPKLNSNIGFTYAFSSGRPYYNPNRPVTQFLSDFTEPYHNLSLNASYLTSIKGNFTVLVLSVSNALGIQNVFGYRYSNIDFTKRSPVLAATPRFVFVGMFINIGKDEFREN